MGYVTHRDGRWYAVAYQGIDPISGRDRRRCTAPATKPPLARSPTHCPPPDRRPLAVSPCRATCAHAGSPAARIGSGRRRRSGTRR